MFIAPGADDNAMMSRLSQLLRVKMGYARQGTGWVGCNFRAAEGKWGCECLGREPVGACQVAP